MTVEELGTELEAIVSGLSASGFDSIDAGIVGKLDQYSVMAGELGMKEGMHLIQNLSSVIKSIKDGAAKTESGAVRLTALDFYVKKIVGGQIEDL
jgi:hypothetical protein